MITTFWVLYPLLALALPSAVVLVGILLLNARIKDFLRIWEAKTPRPPERSKTAQEILKENDARYRPPSTQGAQIPPAGPKL